MCKSVLNDYWISQPTFASEDAGFIAHKKNVYEEALHRSEEERHEYDFHLEAIHRTILFLEPFNNKIAQLSPEERLTYKMNPKFSGNGSGTGAGSSAGKAIQLRILKKVYGKEPGVQVFKAIQEMPSVAIPVVLTRLKQKEEEWKRAQAEWNKVWREVDARNYYKSLDHQGINFRSYDKKQTTSKFLLNQIEVARDEQRFKRSSLIDPLFARTRARHQMEFVVEDVEVVRDAVKVVCSYLDRTGEKVGVGERKKVEGFLRNWVPVFLMMDLAQFNAGFVPRQDSGSVSSADGNGNGAGGNGSGSGSGSGEAEGQSEVEGPLEDVESSGTPPPPSTSHSKTGRGGKRNNSGNNPSGSSGTNGGGGSDLRKRLLKSEQAKSSRRTRATQENSAASSRGSPAVGDAMRVVTNGLGMGRGSGSVPSSPTEGRTTRKGTFYTNTAFYVLIRQFEVCFPCSFLFLLAAFYSPMHSYLIRSCSTPASTFSSLLLPLLPLPLLHTSPTPSRIISAS